MPEQRKKAVSLPVTEPDAAEIIAVPTDRAPELMRCFPTLTVGLERLPDSLQQCQIRTATMA